MVSTLQHNIFIGIAYFRSGIYNPIIGSVFQVVFCTVDFYTYITYNFVVVDFTSNICQKTYPVAVTYCKQPNNKMFLIVLPT
jgi:hypothetical protein